MTVSILQELLKKEDKLELAILVGSRANNTSSPESDWDIAIRWVKGVDYMENIANTETLKRTIASAINIEEAKIDLIDLTRSGLAMRALVAEEGIVLKGENTLPWNYFLSRVWRELEDFEWEQRHAT